MNYRYVYIDMKKEFKKKVGQQIFNMYIDENYSARVIFMSCEYRNNQ